MNNNTQDGLAVEKAENLLESMKQEALREIGRTDRQEIAAAWFHSHLGSLDFARQAGLITENRRRRLYREFQAEARRVRLDEGGKEHGD